MSWRAPETYFAIAALAGVAVVIFVLFQGVPGSTPEQWARLLTVANGPAAVFTAILGGIFGFAVNRANTQTARTEKAQAESERQTAVEEKATSDATVQTVRKVLALAPTDEAASRRDDRTAFVSNFASDAELPEEWSRSRIMGGNYRVAHASAAAPVDPVLDRMTTVVGLARDVLEGRSQDR